jgi:predicted metal-dependent HD superfamily phosphohydrolase
MQICCSGSDDSGNDLQSKISSTFLRKWELMLQYLHPKWFGLALDLGIPDDLAHKWWNLFLKSYCEEARHYHTMFHVESLFKMYDRFSNLVNDKSAVQLAIWFHDIVYNPRKQDNEAQSIQMFKVFSDECLISAVRIVQYCFPDAN